MRKTKFLLPLMLMLAVVMCLPAFAEGENLWYDGGFDNVAVDGEVAQDDDYRDFVGTWANKIKTDAETGNKYMALAGSSAGQPVVKSKQSLGLSSTKTYTLSVDLKNETAGTPSYLQINYHATSGSEAFWNCTNLTTFAATDEWDTYEIELPATANYIYMRAYNGAEGSGSGWIFVDNISIVVTSETEVNMGGLWSDPGFDLLSVSSDEFRHFSQPNWQTSAVTDSTGNQYLRMRGDGDGNPIMRNKTAFDVDTSKKHVITFKVAEVAGTSMEAKVYVYFSNDAITGGYELIDAAKAGTATTINYYAPADCGSEEYVDPAWETVTYTIPAGVDFKYVYFLVPTGKLAIDDISITPVDVEVEPAVVAAGLMDREETDSLAFAAYVTNEATISDFGFEVSATGDFTDAIVVSGCQAVADNGEFCGVDVEANYYMVRVNGIPSADYTVYVRAYAVFGGEKVYSEVASASANDVLDANP